MPAFKIALVLALSTLFPLAAQAAVEPLSLWPAGQMPGLAAVPGAIKPGSEKAAVTTPTITIYPASTGKPAPAILVCPGGGYDHLAIDKEGIEIAKWLNSLGITAAVLKYRVPGNRDGALQDALRAIRLLRSRASDWNIDPTRIGAMGFSAGGHLSARLSTNFDHNAYPALDEIDRASARPDFVVLVYPAYLEVKGQLAPELSLRAKIPPTLILHNEDDTAYIRSSKVYHAALDAAHIPNEFVLFATGGHGYGLRSTQDVKAWPDRCEKWLRKIGVL